MDDENLELGQEFWSLAERFMHFVWEESGFPVIICNHQGVITRAIARHRIGDSHFASRKIMSGEVREYAVTPADAARDPLVKEGYNCAIEVDGRQVGTFGITGKLALAKPLARVAALVLAGWIKENRQQKALNETAGAVFSNIDDLTEQIARMEARVRENLRHMAEVSGDAAKKVKATDHILDTVYRISQQSHILSINGSVEATRAGRHGRAFAVVAQEITRLAENTKKAGQDIRQTLETVQGAIDALHGAIQDSVSLAGEHKELINEIRQRLQSLQNAMESLKASFQDSF